MRQIPILTLLMFMSISIATTSACAQDAKAGEQVFVKCQRCHSLDAGGSQEDGPHLNGIFGRKAGTVESYNGYSEALRSSGVVWTEETLDEYLKKPKAFIKGTTMRFRKLGKEKDRQDLIAYLREATK